ncbi:MAG: hypothetical protein IJU35_08015 [Paludibacteraceae bacterium]|nr:hypothetical protein [Paludibacteraceae bacterium]
MTKQDIISLTNSFLLKELRIEYATLEPDTELRRDLGLSSVDTAATADYIQKTFGCDILLPELKAIVTLQDLYDYIERNGCK